MERIGRPEEVAHAVSFPASLRPGDRRDPARPGRSVFARARCSARDLAVGFRSSSAHNKKTPPDIVPFAVLFQRPPRQATPFPRGRSIRNPSTKLPPNQRATSLQIVGANSMI